MNETHTDLSFSIRYDILNKYKKTFSSEIYTKLWMNIWKKDLLNQLNTELRLQKLNRIISED